MKTNTPVKRRLNPFAFPAETNARFALLIIAALMLAVNMALLMRYAFNSEEDTPFSDYQAFAETNEQRDAPNDVYFKQAVTDSLTLLGKTLSTLFLPSGSVLVILALATVIYRIHPARIRRQKSLESLSHNRDPAFHREIQRLANLAGVSPPPTVELGKGLRSQSGQAFGFRRKYVLRLDGGLRLLMRKAPGMFRAVVLHELAHIVNGDVGRTYFAQALWIAFVLIVVVPLAISIGSIFAHDWIIEPLTEGIANLDLSRLLTKSLPTVLLLCLRAGATLAVVAMIRASLLRIREIYADWRAALWDTEASLSKILQHSASREESVERITRRLWRLHPTARERLAALQDPSRLFRVTLDIPFIVGFLLALVVGGMLELALSAALGLGAAGLVIGASVGNLAQANSSTFLTVLGALAILAADLVVVASLILPFLGAAYLVSGAMSLQVQREAVAEMTKGRQGLWGYLRLWVPAVLISLGLEAGFFINPIGLFSPKNASGALLVLPWLVGVAALTWLCLVYARFFGRRVLGLHVGTSPPKWKRRFLTLAFSGLLWVSYLPFLANRIMIAFPDLDPGILQPLRVIFFATLTAALLFYGLMFIATWTFVRVGWLIRPRRCPSCGQRTRQKVVVGRVCEHCGQELAPWLYADLPPMTNSTSDQLHSVPFQQVRPVPLHLN